MAAFVITSWTVQEVAIAGTTDYVRIQGRAGGFVSWLLALVEISPTVSLVVSEDSIAFEEGSLQGSLKVLTPVENTCSTFYGYAKPWKEAVAIAVFFGFLTIFMLGIPGLIAGGLYYFLNKTLTVGFTDKGGHRHAISFKRSLIEGLNIDETTAARVCTVIQGRVDAKRRAV